MPTMKPMHKRLYTVLPRPVASTRVRSNSASSSRTLFTSTSSPNPLAYLDSPSVLTFFDSPSQPPSSPRAGNISRFTAEVKAEIESPTSYSNHHGQNSPQSQSNSSGPPPYTLALTSGHSDSPAHVVPPNHYPLFPYSPFEPSFLAGPDEVYASKSSRTSDRPATRYHLDVGAYGIPKRSHTSVAGCDGRGKFGAEKRADPQEGLERAVQVGEDAYFVRDNAMGVADGVGGWASSRRVKRGSEASPSALFARRLMHFCSEEVEAATNSRNSDTPSPYEPDELYADLEDSLEELEEGLDVLMILEKAYEKTMRAHVGPRQDDPASVQNSSRPQTPCLPDSSAPPCERISEQHSNSILPSASAFPAPAPTTPKLARTAPSAPLKEGSSTALLAILEHAPAPAGRRQMATLFAPRPRRASASATARVVPRVHYAVLKIAHLGDSMAMLIRGEEIVWRTEEMWWNFNTPVQLGPKSPTRPQDAHVFSVPVQADDILILASDGLSDNLWDEDVLDEVVRFRRPFLAGGSRVGRGAMAAMLSEALCSRARSVSEMKDKERGKAARKEGEEEGGGLDLPFARRAREQGKKFSGGKLDDISVVVAVVSPVEPAS
ncbi:hypothetical protein CERSUDRAFT_156565 [Gelatoporia subvermispora B]|uniref:Protein phosphatase n=1 Tax=Ceriporiopsis subvermispora (strain B) TaxID=914234 RepID=M2RAK9_CERS8|nr:hypothetical protein CERSUDRAFT_156565 [Gelatoporia subvermispora B]